MTSSLHSSIAGLFAGAPLILTSVALAVMMFQFGLQPETAGDRATKRHRRRLILWALLFNFLVVPGLAFAMARAIGIHGPVVTALLLLAASPGGRYAPALVEAMRGDLPLASEITMFLCKLNSIVSPLLAAWMLGAHHIDLHELKYIVELLVLQIIPYYGAQQLCKRRPHVAASLVRPAGWIAAATVVALLVYLVSQHALRVAMLVGPSGWVATLLYGLVLLALGWLVGGRDRRERSAFAVTAEARNLALALVIANLMLHEPPVLLATFGVWLILLALGAAAALFGRAPRPVPAAAATLAAQH